MMGCCDACGAHHHVENQAPAHPDVGHKLGRRGQGDLSLGPSEVRGACPLLADDQSRAGGRARDGLRVDPAPRAHRVTGPGRLLERHVGSGANQFDIPWDG